MTIKNNSNRNIDTKSNDKSNSKTQVHNSSSNSNFVSCKMKRFPGGVPPHPPEAEHDGWQKRVLA